MVSKGPFQPKLFYDSMTFTHMEKEDFFSPNHQLLIAYESINRNKAFCKIHFTSSKELQQNHYTSRDNGTYPFLLLISTVLGVSNPVYTS